MTNTNARNTDARITIQPVVTPYTALFAEALAAGEWEGGIVHDTSEACIRLIADDADDQDATTWTHVYPTDDGGAELAEAGQTVQWVHASIAEYLEERAATGNWS
jgi:hypothetical protein